MKISLINEQQFGEYEGCRQIISHAHSRKFAEIDIGSKAGLYALAWPSDLVEPVILVENDVCYVGVDQRVAAVNMQTGQMLFSFALPTSLLEIIDSTSAIAIVCQSDVIVLNRDYSIRCLHTVGEIIESIQIRGDKLEIATMGCGHLTLRI